MLILQQGNVVYFGRNGRPCESYFCAFPVRPWCCEQLSWVLPSAAWLRLARPDTTLITKPPKEMCSTPRCCCCCCCCCRHQQAGTSRCRAWRVAAQGVRQRGEDENLAEWVVEITSAAHKDSQDTFVDGYNGCAGWPEGWSLHSLASPQLCLLSTARACPQRKVGTGLPRSCSSGTDIRQEGGRLTLPGAGPRCSSSP